MEGPFLTAIGIAIEHRHDIILSIKHNTLYRHKDPERQLSTMQKKALSIVEGSFSNIMHTTFTYRIIFLNV